MARKGKGGVPAGLITSSRKRTPEQIAELLRQGSQAARRGPTARTARDRADKRRRRSERW
jgi:hypothetical protein